MNPFPLYIMAILVLLGHRTAAAIFALVVLICGLQAQLAKPKRRNR